MLTEMNGLKSQLETLKEKISSAESMQEHYRTKNSSLRDYTTLLAQQNEQIKSRCASVESDLLKVNSFFLLFLNFFLFFYTFLLLFPCVIV